MSPSKLLALYAFGAHFHSGQSSRGYRISCRAQRLLNRYNNNPDWLSIIEDLIAAESRLTKDRRSPAVTLYWTLVDNHADAV